MSTALPFLIGKPPPRYSTVAQDGARATHWTAGNTYTWGLIRRAGVLYLFYTESPSTEHAPGTAAKMRTSSDDGATWSAATTLYSGGGAGRHGNVESAFLTSTGRILVSLDDQDDADAFDVKAMVIYSDNGSTWSSPYEVPNTFSGDCVGGTFAELPDGSIVHAIYGEETGVVGGNTFCKVVLSSDEGETFGSETTLASSASRTYAEPQIAYVNGQIVALLRSDTNQHTWRSTSTDGSTWSAPSDVVVMSGPAQFLEWGPSRLFLMARNNNTQFRGRWATSLDRGATWTSPAEVDTGETRELDSTAMCMIDATHFLTVYALANSSSSSTVYSRLWELS